MRLTTGFHKITSVFEKIVRFFHVQGRLCVNREYAVVCTLCLIYCHMHVYNTFLHDLLTTGS